MNNESQPPDYTNGLAKNPDEKPIITLHRFIIDRNPYQKYQIFQKDTNRPGRLDNHSFELALSDLRRAKVNPDPTELEQFKKDWGDEYYILDRISRPSESDLPDTLINEITTIAKAMMMVPQLKEAERNNLFKLIGYSSKEIQEISKNIAIAGTQGAIAFGIAYAAVGVAAWYGFQNPYLHNDPNATEKLIKIHIIHLAAASIKSLQNTRMVEDTGVSSDPAQTTIHQVLLKTFPDKKKLRLAISFAAGLGPALISEIQTAAVAIPTSGTTIDYMRSWVGAIFDTSVGIYAQYAIKKNRRILNSVTNQPNLFSSNPQE